MSKRTADFQLTSENYEFHEYGKEEAHDKDDECSLGKEGGKGDVIESMEAIGARKMVRARRRFEDSVGEVFGCGGVDLEEKKSAEKVVEEVESEKKKSAEKEEEVESEEKKSAGKEEEVESEEKKSAGKEEEVESEEKKNAEKGDEVESEEKKSTEKKVLPFGGSGFGSSFRNPFVSLAANSESSNFLFSSFGGEMGESGRLGHSAGALEGEEGSNEDEFNEEEQENRVFTGEEHEETVYQCKNVDLFVLRTQEGGEKSFKKLATGIIHLNVPKEVTAGEKDAELEQQTVTQPRMIFRQKGIYKVLLNSPLSLEMSKTFQRNRNIRKGFATSFIALGQDSGIQQCMFRFQNEADLIDFTEKLDQIVKGT